MPTSRHSGPESPSTARVIVFDVIETLLDLRALAPVFRDTFGDEVALDEFFGQMLQSAFAITVAGHYQDFGAVARASLTMVANRRGVVLGDQAIIRILDGLRSLPAHQDVPGSLARLQRAGFQISALSNSAPAVLEAQLRSAGIVQHFTRTLSVDTTRAFKPAAAVYRDTAQVLQVSPENVRLVAAHSWDVGGALLAGCRAAFVARPGAVLNPLFPRPDIVEPNLDAVTSRIIDLDVPLISLQLGE